MITTEHPTTRESVFFSRVHGIFTKIVFWAINLVSEYKKIQFIQIGFCEHSGIKLEIKIGI